jgi:hypothetical protein
MSLVLVPISLEEANAFVEAHHRHNAPVPGAKFSVACSRDNQIVGVAIVGRPVARPLDDGWTLEVNRVATDGSRNANSFLYGAVRRAAWALGYRRLVTYTLKSESGASLRASGYRVVAEITGRSWNCPSRPRVDTHPLQDKLRWESVA